MDKMVTHKQKIKGLMEVGMFPGGPIVDRETFVGHVRSFLGVPFVHQGRSRYGLDCVGLVIKSARDFDLMDYQEEPYDRRPDGRLVDRLREYLLRKQSNQVLEPGDVICFRLPKHPCHIAIYSGDNRIIHALSSNGQVVEHILDQRWRERIVEVYQIPGVVD